MLIKNSLYLKTPLLNRVLQISPTTFYSEASLPFDPLHLSLILQLEALDAKSTLSLNFPL